MFKQQFSNASDACALAEAIVDTVREPLLVLDHDLRVIAASRSFYLTFAASSEAVLGKPFYELGDGAWNIPALRSWLGQMVCNTTALNDFEVEHTFPGVGPRVMRLNARQVSYTVGAHTTILLGLEDVTRQRDLARQNEELLRQKDVLLEEFQHRVGNSLAIIASIISLKARSVSSEEARRHLDDARDRVISFANIQQSLHASARSGVVALGPHFARLCQAIAQSMIADHQRIRIETRGGGKATTSEAESLGLIVTELVINSLKHAFPEDAANGLIVVSYESCGAGWTLSVSDNGTGKTQVNGRVRGGLGTGIIAALAKQLGADVTTVAGRPGTIVTVRRAAAATRTVSAGASPSAASRTREHAE
ncbi:MULTISPECIES: sensor histidine kinase [Bradyrhizobium]|jgi:chemotaxis protein methyltransferase CheR|uniref:histidine kinase n=3 Tax=Bradyrhizobium TaxID=374 RepID=A0ABS5GDL4_9BRAD|nr:MULTISPECIES: histidine kinase dimerization/phosphoacceptor domain -containing protein [Bradyrhizobium]MBR1139270.1 PAS domain-containing protein [Bradyrhizobium denitrificans]MDU0957208.1 histidine kinase dimerization/phosphoacceptor domain -containing protein [Bradyrhizobium sp.]MDU1495207.1 histidine kinase dimerization/phosphoacceptor domain -containing protein [Bradyrhizobium sp.]MDU1545294.1 histidine kinase dimerization/phosphoacceptor domain -containing protein [Bradyrhizobium sp.]M